MDNEAQTIVNVETDVKQNFVLNRSESTYGSFKIGASEFVLCVSHVKEVVNEPSSYTSMPLAPDYLLGLFNLRGTIIPVISLGKIFNVDYALGSNSENGEKRKVVILEYGDMFIGILFDCTGEIFNHNSYERTTFTERGENNNDKVVQGVLKVDNGDRILQILDPLEMLKLDKVPTTAIKKEDMINRKGMRKQCISFSVGESICAIDIEGIQEIIKIKNLANNTLAGKHCLGAVNVRGITVPVIDLSSLLGYGARDIEEVLNGDINKLIIMRLDDSLFGLLVDSVENILFYYSDEMVPFPVLSKEKKSLFMGCISDKDSNDIILLDSDAILSRDEVMEITKGNHHLFGLEKEQVVDSTISEESIVRTTYITFAVGNTYAIEIEKMHEIIDYPKELVKPPQSIKHIEGMLNLRGELVAVINPRKLYGQPDQEILDKKVIVFIFEGTKYGLVVDAINEIAVFTNKDSVEIPRIVYETSGRSLSNDVGKALQSESGDIILVMDIPKLVNKITK